MPFTAGDVILSARDLHAAFDPTRHPNAVCWRFLTRYVKTLTSRVAEVRPRALPVTVTTATLPLAVFANGTPIPPDLLLLEVTARPTSRRSDDVRVPVEMLPGSQRLAGHTRVPWAWRSGSTLFLGGSADQWTGFDLLELRTIAMPATVANDSAELPFPDDALDVVTASLAAFLAKREATNGGSPPFNPGQYVSDADAAESTFLSRLTNQKRAEVFTMRRVRD
jgi:hypothetical protein